MPRYYTADEANRLLPDVRRVVDQVRQAYRALADPSTREAFASSRRANGGGKRLEGALQQAATFQRGMRQLEAWDCVLRDPDSGLLDFPAVRDGKEVWLCWLPEEDRVAYWHPTETGFAGRQPL